MCECINASILRFRVYLFFYIYIYITYKVTQVITCWLLGFSIEASNTRNNSFPANRDLYTFGLKSLERDEEREGVIKVKCLLCTSRLPFAEHLHSVNIELVFFSRLSASSSLAFSYSRPFSYFGEYQLLFLSLSVLLLLLLPHSMSLSLSLCLWLELVEAIRWEYESTPPVSKCYETFGHACVSSRTLGNYICNTQRGHENAAHLESPATFAAPPLTPTSAHLPHHHRTLLP